MKPSTHCSQLLEKGRQFHVIFGNRLANHLSMVLIALENMGAGDETLTSYYHYYEKRLAPFDSAIEAEPVDLPSTLGKRAHFYNHLASYTQQIEQQGIESALTTSLPQLLPGLSASAFHALIRLGYGVEVGDPKEIAYALSYWSSEFQPLGKISPVTSQPLEAIIEMMTPIAVDYTFAPGIIVDHMAEIAQHPDFKKAHFQPENLTLDQLAHLAIKAYLATDDFTLLHGVTGCHALRMILPFVENKERALRYYWQALIAAYLTTGPASLTSQKQKIEINFSDWKQIKQAACSSNNDHIIKMVYTCFSEHQNYGFPEYLTSANQVLEWTDE